jgi:hypothetical protein
MNGTEALVRLRTEADAHLFPVDALRPVSASAPSFSIRQSRCWGPKSSFCGCGIRVRLTRSGPRTAASGFRMRSTAAFPQLHDVVQRPINRGCIEVGFARAASESLRRGGLDVTYVETDAGHWVLPELLDRFPEFVDGAVGTGQ